MTGNRAVNPSHGVSTELILVRHGETEWNREHRMQGHRDSPLSETGWAQARRLGGRLKDETFGALYSSDLGRARNTAQSVADATGHEIIVDARLRERHFGVFEGLTTGNDDFIDTDFRPAIHRLLHLLIQHSAAARAS